MLGHDELMALINSEPPLVSQMISKDEQVQQNGVELTLHSIESFHGAGCVAFDNSERVLPDMKVLEFGKNGWLYLPKGVYKIKFNEIVTIPKDMAGIAKPRSSVMRCGVEIFGGVWDAGYSGRSEGLIVVYNEAGFEIKKNARVIQLLFYKLHEVVENGYSGKYLNENVDTTDNEKEICTCCGKLVWARNDFESKEDWYRRTHGTN